MQRSGGQRPGISIKVWEGGYSYGSDFDSEMGSWFGSAGNFHGAVGAFRGSRKGWGYQDCGRQNSKFSANHNADYRCNFNPANRVDFRDGSVVTTARHQGRADRQ